MAYLTGAGLAMPRQADFLAEVKREYKARTGQDLDVEYDSVLGSLVSVVTLQLDQVAEAVQQLAARGRRHAGPLAARLRAMSGCNGAVDVSFSSFGNGGPGLARRRVHRRE